MREAKDNSQATK